MYLNFNQLHIFSMPLGQALGVECAPQDIEATLTAAGVEKIAAVLGDINTLGERVVSVALTEVPMPHSDRVAVLAALCDRAESLLKLLRSLRLLIDSDLSPTTAAPGSSSVLLVEVDVADVHVDVTDTNVDADKLMRVVEKCCRAGSRCTGLAIRTAAAEEYEQWTRWATRRIHT